MSEPSPAAADRNLLFGVLALQMDFIDREALVRALHAWILDKAKALGQILVEQGSLAVDRRALLESLVNEHLKRHDGDPKQCLATLSSLDPARDDLGLITDADVQASLAAVSVHRTLKNAGITRDDTVRRRDRAEIQKDHAIGARRARPRILGVRVKPPEASRPTTGGGCAPRSGPAARHCRYFSRGVCFAKSPTSFASADQPGACPPSHPRGNFQQHVNRGHGRPPTREGR